MIKLVAFDLDGTLAKIGEPISKKTIALLKELEENGITIAISSGKPTYYLCGVVRQIGLKNAILIGENGAVVQYGITLPPKKYMLLNNDNSANSNIKFFKDEVLNRFPSIWTQPNTAIFTPFPKRKEEFDVIEKLINDNKNKTDNISIYRFIDCFDFIPKNISKGNALKIIGKDLGIDSGEMISVGDSVNDYSMFDYTFLSVGVNTDKEKVNYSYDTIEDALKFIIIYTRQAKLTR